MRQMKTDSNNNAPGLHPSRKEALPGDPLELRGFEIPGDPGVMLQVLVEEYGRMGWSIESIMGLAEDPNYQGFHRLLGLYGEAGLRERVGKILARCGTMRVQTMESGGIPELVQISVKQGRNRESR